jgi:hypothetical protein
MISFIIIRIAPFFLSLFITVVILVDDHVVDPDEGRSVVSLVDLPAATAVVGIVLVLVVIRGRRRRAEPAPETRTHRRIVAIRDSRSDDGGGRRISGLVIVVQPEGVVDILEGAEEVIDVAVPPSPGRRGGGRRRCTPADLSADQKTRFPRPFRVRILVGIGRGGIPIVVISVGGGGDGGSGSLSS